ncbi:MAG: DUF1343 domain-containing protein [Cytophagales bacterium]|nr:DUF1343 domain-containing protein [Armatimonadota bacterium]
MPRVRTGIEALASGGFRSLQGQKVGLVTNPTGVLPDLSSTVEALRRAPGVRLRALFGPEHGVRGDVPAGEMIGSGRDSATGLPVYSLYGSTKVPTAGMLRGLDVLVFDLQDIGTRSYTYLSTLGCVMEGASRHKIPLVVLDRPNPLGLRRIEGGPTRPGFFSFISKYPVPFRHGMTLGELARMINRRGWLPGGRPCELTVIPCENLMRSLVGWEALGDMPWVPTSPHIPRPESALFYAATGIVGELSTLSIGIGFPLPFELAGAPDIGADSLAREMGRRNLPGFAFRPMSWEPYYAAYRGKRCGGVQVYVTDPAAAPLSRLNFEILDALRALQPGRSFFVGKEPIRMFDLSCGTDQIRRAFQAGAKAPQLWQLFSEGTSAFEQARKPYLLYP